MCASSCEKKVAIEKPLTPDGDTLPSFSAHRPTGRTLILLNKRCGPPREVNHHRHPTVPYHRLVYPTLPHPTLPYTTLPYPTLLDPTLSYLTMLCPTLSYCTLPFPTLLYPTLPYPKLP